MIDYILSGKNPKILFSTGVHGDEPVMVALVTAALKKYKAKLPSYLYIPKVSPSALALGTRKNGHGLDINRCFGKADVSEVEGIKEQLKDYHFDLHVDFHEDTILYEFYLYDCVTKAGESELALKILEKVRGLGVKLWNGIDDPDDPALGNKVVNGYCRSHQSPAGMSFDEWTVTAGVAQGAIVPEIPGMVTKEMKKKIVEAIFQGIMQA
ncbi:succinylglutamate desuccinylase/aspartoacylase family protein [Candidatus Microgenomates bacterium]|nr:succinylglutamate desuccinylase/aspartoacylase family protein [Candidatus Microgenomates bacterium]